VLDSWLQRHYASDFLADSELFADCCAFLAHDEQHAHDYQLKANLFVTMQVEIGTARRMVRVSCDALTSELLWALLHAATMPGVGGARAAERPLCALRRRRRHCVVDLPARGCARRRVRVRGGSAPTLPTRSRSGTACRRVRRRCRFSASGRGTKRMLKHCSDELDLKSRTLLDYHPVEDGAGGARRLLCSCDRAS
jgi:hypothetical protein